MCYLIGMRRRSAKPSSMSGKRANKKVWTTRDGRRIPIVAMEDRHLVNTIKYLYRLAAVSLAAELAAGYSVLGTLNGDMAQFCCEQDLDRMQDTEEEEWLESQCPQWPALIKELNRRGLDKTFAIEYAEELEKLRIGAEVHFLLDHKPHRD